MVPTLFARRAARPLFVSRFTGFPVSDFDALFDDLLRAPFPTLAASRPVDPSVRVTSEDEQGASVRVEIDVPGYPREALDVSVDEGILVVKASASDKARGLAASRSFERRFRLGDDSEVEGAELVDGVLTVRIKRIIPERPEPRRVEIR